jgi:GlpG protein
MRRIGQLQDQNQAQRFVDFMYGEGMEGQADPLSKGRWEIWVHDEAHVEAASSLLEKYRRNPEDPAFVQGARTARQKRKDEEVAEVPQRNRVINARTVFSQSSVSLGVLTIALIVISVIVSLVTQLGSNDRLVQVFSIATYQHQGDYLVWEGALPEVRQGQVWRLFTPIFLHFHILHILFNMLWLKDLGSMIEFHRGRWVLAGLVLVIGATSNVGQYLVSGPNFGGMSGVVYGLLGYVWMQGRFNPASNLALEGQTVIMMIVWFFLCLTGLMGNVANTAHGVGLGVGMAWGFIAARWATQRGH